MKTYTDDEFKEQKKIIDGKIKQQMSLVHDKYDKSSNMDEALEYCFNFVKNTAETWKKLATKPEDRLCFQKMITEENVEFSGDKFGNAKLTPIYKTYQEFLLGKSTLVAPRGFEPRLTD